MPPPLARAALLGLLALITACGGAPPPPAPADAAAPPTCEPCRRRAEAAATACKPGLPCVADITGFSTLCHRLRTGEVRCAGQNHSHQITTASYDEQPTPTPLALPGPEPIAPADDLHVGHGYACALRTGAVYCWGSRLYGRLGDGQTEGSREAPAPVEGLPPVVELAGGFDSTCARTADGAVWCWGGDLEGEQGNGDADDAPRPHRLALPPVDALAAGARHYCALTADRAVWCWGAHHAAYAPDPMERPLATPTRLDPLGPAAPGARLALQLWAACLVEPTTGARCWGRHRGYLTGEWFDGPTAPVTAIADARDVVVALEHACVVSTAGRVRCAGLDSDGRLGAVQTGEVDDWVEVEMPFAEPVARLHALPEATCAISERGDVACWGDNAGGQLGVGASEELVVPKPTRPAW